MTNAAVIAKLRFGAMALIAADTGALATAASAFTTVLIFSAMVCFSMLCRSITRRIGGAAFRTTMRMTTSINGTDRRGSTKPSKHPRASRAKLQRKGPKISAYLRIRRMGRRLSSNPPIASNVSSGPRVKPGSILRLPAAPPGSSFLPRRGRTI